MNYDGIIKKWIAENEAAPVGNIPVATFADTGELLRHVVATAAGGRGAAAGGGAVHGNDRNSGGGALAAAAAAGDETERLPRRSTRPSCPP